MTITTAIAERLNDATLRADELGLPHDQDARAAGQQAGQHHGEELGLSTPSSRGCDMRLSLSRTPRRTSPNGDRATMARKATASTKATTVNR